MKHQLTYGFTGRKQAGETFWQADVHCDFALTLNFPRENGTLKNEMSLSDRNERAFGGLDGNTVDTLTKERFLTWSFMPSVQVG